jgi:hypothetical protein
MNLVTSGENSKFRPNNLQNKLSHLLYFVREFRSLSERGSSKLNKPLKSSMTLIDVFE